MINNIRRRVIRVREVLEDPREDGNKVGLGQIEAGVRSGIECVGNLQVLIFQEWKEMKTKRDEINECNTLISPESSLYLWTRWITFLTGCEKKRSNKKKRKKVKKKKEKKPWNIIEVVERRLGGSTHGVEIITVL